MFVLWLILAALALVGYNQWDASRAQQESDDALMALEQIRIQRQCRQNQHQPQRHQQIALTVLHALGSISGAESSQ